MKEAPVYYTIILASNRGGETYRLRIAHSWVKAGCFLVFSSLLFIFTAAADYTGLLSKSSEHEVLVTENLDLKEHTLTAEGRLSSAHQKLERIHTLTAKLKVISNMGTSEANLAGAPATPMTEIEDVTPRQPASTPAPAVAPQKSAWESTQAVRKNISGLFQIENGNTDSSLPMRIEQNLRDARLREQELMTTWDALSDRQNMLSSMPSIKPAHGYYSSSFGYRYDPINGRPLLHAGVDIASPWGTPVLAPGDGVVSFAGYEGGYGNLVSIDHGYGVTTRFAHNSRIFVTQGQRVHRWDPISAVGSTGHSTGAHVHYEVRVHGLPVDPLNYILQDN